MFLDISRLLTDLSVVPGQGSRRANPVPDTLSASRRDRLARAQKEKDWRGLSARVRTSSWSASERSGAAESRLLLRSN